MYSHNSSFSGRRNCITFPQPFVKSQRKHTGARKRTRSAIHSYTEGSLSSLALRLEQQKAKGFLPSLELSQQEAVERQLQVLKENNAPHPDHGLEIMYRYSSFDPFERSTYFGRSLDLGQFERFRRIFHTPTYSVLLCHKEHRMLSSLKVSDHKWKQRVEVQGMKPNSSGCFTFTMVQWAKQLGMVQKVQSTLQVLRVTDL